MSYTHTVGGHTLTLLRNGAEYFPRLVAAMDKATRSIYLETYIYAADIAGRTVSDALQRAARRGVEVRLLLDGYGSSGLPPSWVEELLDSGVEVIWFRKEAGRFIMRRYRLRRLHRKLALIDERIAFVGGININDDAAGGSMTSPRLDYAVEVQGKAVQQIYVAMQRLWVLVLWSNLRRHREHATPLPTYTISAVQQVDFLLRDNIRHRRDIERAYLKAIVSAKHEIIIANAYFLPGRRLRRALAKAALRGVHVVLLLQGRVEYRLQHFATHALYDELLAAGVRIYEYSASLMHAKVAVVDSYWATVGSSNIDPFSLWLAREANLVVLDKGFAESLRTSLMDEMAQRAHRVSHSVWRKHSIWVRLIMRLSYAAVRFLAGVSGYARNRDDV